MPQTRSASFILAVTLASFGLPGCSFSYSASSGSKSPSSSEGRAPNKSSGRAPARAPASSSEMDKGRNPSTPAPADPPAEPETETETDTTAPDPGSNRPAAPSDSNVSGTTTNSTLGAKKPATQPAPKGITTKKATTKPGGISTKEASQPTKEMGLKTK